MVRPHHVARKSTGHQPTCQLAPRDVPPQPKSQLNSPQYVPQEEDSFEIVVTIPTGEDTQEAQQMSHNDSTTMMRTTFPWVIPRRNRHTTTPMRLRPSEMKPRSPPANWGICWIASTSPLRHSSESREFHTLDKKTIRQSWRSSVD
jgi:hypothetical protein